VYGFIESISAGRTKHPDVTSSLHPLTTTPARSMSQELCIQVVADNFELQPSFGNLSGKFTKKVTENLTLDLPLELAGTVRCLAPNFISLAVSIILCHLLYLMPSAYRR
jgi:hypothetical protein